MPDEKVSQLTALTLADVADELLINDVSVTQSKRITVENLFKEFLIAASASVPSAPAAGYAKMFARSLAGRIMPGFIGPSGLDVAVQPFIGRNKVCCWTPIGNSNAAPLADGIAAPTAGGTATARNVATTNMFTSTKRLGYVSSATAGNSAGARLAVLQFWRGNAAGLGGFHLVIRFGFSDAATVAQARSFVGMCATTSALANSNPSALTNIIGVGYDSTQTTLRILHNDGSGTATAVDLGANFPSNTNNTDMYDLILFCPPNGSDVKYAVIRLNTGHESTGTISTNLPASTQLLAPQIWRNNGTTALAVGIDMNSLYIETDV